MPPEPKQRFTIGRWSVDVRLDELACDGRVVRLEPRTMRLLATLAEPPGELVTTQALLDTVCGRMKAMLATE